MMPSWAAEAAGSKWRDSRYPGASAALTASSPAHETLNLRDNSSANSRFTEHARLKDHVSSMEGGLEAKVNEGGKQHSIPSVLSFHPIHDLPPVSSPSMPASFRRLLHPLIVPHRLSRGRPRTHVTPRRPAGRTFLTPKFACRTGNPAGVCVANYCGGYSCEVVPLLDGEGCSLRVARVEVHARNCTWGVPHPTGSGADVPGSEAKSPRAGGSQ